MSKIKLVYFNEELKDIKDLIELLIYKDNPEKCQVCSKKGKPCSWKSIENSFYCKRHFKKFKNIIPIELEKYITCSTCRNLFKKEDDYKTCSKCRKIGKIKRVVQKQKRILCNGIITIGKRKGKKCRCKIFEKGSFPKYCSKHQTYGKFTKLTNDGHKVCSQWIRGCFNIIDDDFSNCSECRKKEHTQDTIRRKKRKVNSLKYNETNELNKMCYVCGKIYENKKFIDKRCVICYDRYRGNQDNRYDKDIYKNKLCQYKRSPKKRNIKWELTDEFAMKLLKSPCHYCGNLITINGIDRVDNSFGYIIENVVSCCTYCNFMKRDKTKNDFINIATYIVYKNLSENDILIFKDIYKHPDEIENGKKLFKCSKNIRFCEYKKRASNSGENGIAFELSLEIFKILIKQHCHYCKNDFNGRGCSGIDRIDSKFGYFLSNCVPSCYTCNIMKNSLSVNDFMLHLKKIAHYNIYKKPYELDDTIENKICKLFQFNRILSKTKFLQLPDFYNKLSFNSSFDDVSKIKIELEFVENKKQKDIWNYYRKHISSLPKFKFSKLIGRQIYILVKDKTTSKYLGIMSLSSDVKNLACRDEYIGWCPDDKYVNKKLNCIMNLSTCVSLQPFGFNFNGGKLLTSLAFSKEVCDYFEKKYSKKDKPAKLLGITTMGLHGKSVQYSRLKCLKFIGFTKGTSTKNISPEITALCREYLEKKGYKYSSMKKYIIVRKAFQLMQFADQSILYDKPKGIYFGYISPESKDYLVGKTPKLPEIKCKTSQEICDWWIKRWAEKRCIHLKKTGRYK